MPKISVVIPVHNVEEYLRECVDSVINQTMRDIEIICVNDGSDDNSRSILEEYSDKYKKIEIINQANKGQSNARNVGLAAAKGEYIVFLDSDDYLEPNALETIYMASREKKPDIIVFGADTFPKEPKTYEWYDITLTATDKYRDRISPLEFLNDESIKPFIWRSSFKRDFLKKNKLLFPEKLKIGEDMAFAFYTFPKARGILYIKDVLYNYRWVRENSVMDKYNYNYVEKAKQHILVLEHITKNWIKNGYLKQVQAEYMDWYIDYVFDPFNDSPVDAQRLLAEQIVTSWRKTGLLKHMDRLNSKGRQFAEKLIKMEYAEKERNKNMRGLRYILKEIIPTPANSFHSRMDRLEELLAQQLDQNERLNNRIDELQTTVNKLESALSSGSGFYLAYESNYLEIAQPGEYLPEKNLDSPLKLNSNQ